MNKKKSIIIVSIAFLLIVTTLFISYGYMTAEVTGNESSKKAVFNSKLLKLEYSDGTETLTSNQDVFTPGSIITKTFTIKNIGNTSIKYSINLSEVINSFTRKEDIIYELKENDNIVKNGINDAKGIFPDRNSTILNKDIINEGESKTYTLVIKYLNSDENQIVDSGKSLSAKIVIEDSKVSLDKLIVYGNSVQGRLPSEYQEVEYIKTTGTQYIDSGVPLKSGLKTIVDWVFEETTTNNTYSGGHIGDNRWLIGSTRNSVYYFAVGANNMGTEFKFGNRDVIEAYWKDKGSYIIVNGVKSKNAFDTYTLSDEPNYTFYMGANNRNGTANLNPKITIYSWKFYQDDVLIRDFVPCYRKSDNEIGMYDLVTGVFYKNNGTGTFDKGPTLPTPDKPYEIESVGDKTKNLLSTNSYELTGKNLEKVIFSGNLSLPATISWKIDYKPRNQAALFEFIIDGKSQYVNALQEQFVLNGTELTQIKIKNWGQDVGTVTNIQLEEGNVSTEYEPYGYKIPVKVSGKNLLKTNKTEATSNNTEVSVTNDNGKVHVYGTATTTANVDRIFVIDNPQELVGKTLVAKNVSDKVFTYAHLYAESGTVWNWISHLTGQYSNIVPEDVINIEVGFAWKAGEIDETIYPQIEVGTTATDYEPYVEPITTNIYLDEPLRKVGDYADYIDFENRKVVRKIAEYKFNGDDIYNNEGWNSPTETSAGLNMYGLVMSQLYKGSSNNSMGIGLSSHFSIISKNSDFVLSTVPIFCIRYNTWRNLQFAVDPIKFPDLSTWKSYLKGLYDAGTPLTVTGVLDESYIIEEKLEIPDIPSNIGTINVEVNTSILPSKVEVDYQE